jgi:hypothetical protein
MREPSHAMLVGADDLGSVSPNVGSVADNVGRHAAWVLVNLGPHPR